MRERPSQPSHAEGVEQVAHRLRVSPATRVQRPIPRARIWSFGHVFVLDHLEPGCLEGAHGFGCLDHICDAVSLFDVDADLAQTEIFVVVLFRHDPFVDAKDAAGLEDSEDFGVHVLQGRGVDCGLDSVDRVKGVVFEGDSL